MSDGVGSITIKYFKDGEPLTEAPTTIGTYTVQLEVAEGNNYHAADITSDNWTFTFDIADEVAHTGVMLV